MTAEEFLKEKLQRGPAVGLTCDISSKCTLECSGCLRNTYRNMGMHPGHNGKDLTREQFDKIIQWYDTVNLCGQVSDPILNPDFEYFLSRGYELGKRIKINTAATVKTKQLDWYKRMFDVNPKAKWTFGIDGIKDESEWYRVNQDSHLIWDAMMLAATYPEMEVVWQFIVFRTNENSVELAAEIAKENNITLRLDITREYGPHDMLKPTNQKYCK